MILHRKAASLFMMGLLSFTGEVTALLMSSDYTPDSSLEAFADLDGTQILSQTDVGIHRFDEVAGHFLMEDLLFLDVPEEQEIGSVVLMVDGEFEEDSFLLFSFSSLSNLPLTTTGGVVTVSHPTGFFGIADSGELLYKNGVVTQAALESGMSAIIAEDFATVIYNTSELAEDVIYLHSSGNNELYSGIHTKEINGVSIEGHDFSSSTNQISLLTSQFKFAPMEEDELILGNTRYKVAGIGTTLYKTYLDIVPIPRGE